MIDTPASSNNAPGTNTTSGADCDSRRDHTVALRTTAADGAVGAEAQLVLDGPVPLDRALWEMCMTAREATADW